MDNVPVYFSQDGIQIKGGFAEDGRYYDKDSGALVTKTFKELLTYIGRDDINNQNVYTTAWYYLDADGKPLTGPQTFGNSHLYFLPNGAQVKGRFAPMMDTIMIKTLVLSSLIALFMSTTGITEISMVIASSTSLLPFLEMIS